MRKKKYKINITYATLGVVNLLHAMQRRRGKRLQESSMLGSPGIAVSACNAEKIGLSLVLKPSFTNKIVNPTAMKCQEFQSCNQGSRVLSLESRNSSLL